MLKKIFIIASILIHASLGLGQTTYSSNPTVGTYTSCPSNNVPNTCPSGTFLGNTINFKLNSITSTHFVFRVKKCTGGAFTQGGTSYIKDGGVCGTVVGSQSFNSGSSLITISVPIPAYFNSGTNNEDEK